VTLNPNFPPRKTSNLGIIMARGQIPSALDPASRVFSYRRAGSSRPIPGNERKKGDHSWAADTWQQSFVVLGPSGACFQNDPMLGRPVQGLKC
jgi:hypothetical protein